MGIDQLVTGGDVDDPVVDSLTSDSVKAGSLRRTSDTPVLIGSVGRREDFSGADADARLDSALAAASPGDLIVLENATYTDDRTFDGRINFDGNTVSVVEGAVVEGTWTFNKNQIQVTEIGLDGGVFEVNTPDSRFLGIKSGISGGTINVNADRIILSQINGNNVTFDGSTVDGIIDTSANITVTDNGSNTIGDIA